MNFIKVPKVKNSALKSQVSISEDGGVLYIHASGTYKSGSAGNVTGLSLFSILTSNYFVYDPFCIILDLSELDYTWGNTLLRSLNFFQEIGRDEDEKQKVMVIIVSPKNEIAISGLLSMTSQGNRMLCNSKDQAEKLAEIEVKKYLN